jgi:branched-chain amino acid transport system ATP-binding protein
VLEVRELSRHFGGLAALTDVSFSVERGRVLGVIGPNGAGKSTLVNLVTGHLRPSRGRVLIEGKDVTGARPWTIAQAHVARTFQIVKPFRHMTVRENVAIGAMYGPERERSVAEALLAADEILHVVGLAAKADQTPSELGVADARRLELAKALASRARLLLLDEVMAGLRPKEVEYCVELIHQLRDSGVTIVAVEHVMQAILSISDDVLVLHHGRVLTFGKPREVLSDERVIEAYLGRRYAQRRSG